MASEETPATQPTAPVKKPFYRRPKVWLVSLAGLVALPLVLLVAVYFALNSSLVKKLVWPQVQPILAEQGFAADIDDLRLSLFSRFYLKNLQIQQLASDENKVASANDPTVNCGNFRLSLDEVEVNYALWPLITKQHLEVSQLKVSDLTAEGCLLLDLNAETPEKEPEATEELDLEASLNQLVSLLNNPPLSFNLKELSLSNINFDLEVKEVNQQLAASWQGKFELNGKATWQAETITAQLTSNLTSYQQLTVEVNNQAVVNEVDSHLNLSTQPEAAINLDLVIAKQGETWQLEVEPTSSRFSLIDTQLTLEESSFEENSKQAAETLAISLPSYQLNLIPSYANQRLEVQLNQQISQLVLKQNQQTEVELAAVEINLTNLLEISPDFTYFNQLTSQLTLAITGLASEHSYQPLNFNQQLNLQLQPQAEKLNLTASSQLNQLQLVQLEASLANQSLQPNQKSQQLNLNYQLAVNLPLELAEVLTEPALAELPGNLSFSTQGTSQLAHGLPSLEELLGVLAEDFNKLTGKFNHASNFNLELTQPTGDLQLEGPLIGSLSLATDLPSYNPSVKLQLASQGVMHPPLAKALPLEANLEAQLDKGLTQLTSKLKLALANQPSVNLQLDITDNQQQLNLASQLDTNLPASLASYLPDLQPLAELGSFKANHQLTSQLHHPYTNAQELAASELNLNRLKFKLDQQLTLNQQPAKKAEVKLAGPLSLNQQLNWQASGANTQAKLLIAGLEVPETLTSKNLAINLKAKANHGLEPSAASWQLTSQADELTVYEDGQALNALEALPLQSHGKLAFNQQTQEVDIKEAVIQLGELFYQQLSGIAKLANPEEPSLQLSGVTQLTPNENSHLLKAFNVTAAGKLNFPWQLLVEEGKHLAFSGEPSFTNFNLSTPEVELTNLNAQLKLNEELSLGANNKLRFRYLLTPEAFERVDFSQIEPFLNPTGNFSFSQLTVKEEGANLVSLGPLEAKLALEQNLVELPYFSLVALDGNLAGQFYFDLNPQGWRLGLLSRITQLDLRQLLANSANTKTSNKNNSSKHAPVSARTAVEFDFNQRLLTGRIDITDINRPQLLQLLELVDPEYTDPQINQVRTALRFAHPQWLSVQMQNGLMNLDFGLSLFSQPLRAHGLPLSPIIERFGEAALALPDELPLESP